MVGFSHSPGHEAAGPFRIPNSALRISMKTATFDGVFRFDDPNLHWGDPSYLLEPGDPGYVAPAPISQLPLKPKKRPHT